jgi:hypothetical protein
MNTSTTWLRPEDMLIAENMISEANTMMLSMVVMVVFYLLMFYSLYKINKKLWEKHAWLSFIPLVQYYSFASAAWKSLLYYIILPFLAYIISFVLMMILMFNGWMLIWWLLVGLSYIYMIVMWVRLNHGISKRCDRTWLTTLWLIFIPFIMLPVIAYTLKSKTSPIEKKQETIEL